MQSFKSAKEQYLIPNKNCWTITQKIAVVEASEICQSSFDHELGASRHQIEKRGEDNVGAAGNDVKFLTSS
jgi:hypothetical protein